MGRIKMEGPSGENRLKADTETRCNRHFVGQTWSLRIFLPLLSLFFSLSSLFLLEGEERFVRIMGYDKPIECFGEISCDHSLGVTQDFESTFLEKCTENVYTFRTCYYLPNLLRLFERNVLNGRGMNIEGRNDLVHWGGDYTGKRNRERGCRLRRSMTFVGRGIGIERRKLMKSLSNWFDIIVKKRRFWLKHE